MAIIPNDDVLRFYEDLDRLDGCQEVFVLPQGFKSSPPSGGVRWPSFTSVELGLASFDAMAAAEPTFDDYMAGHIGYPGGVPTAPRGHPILFGVVDQHGTEWWLTAAEGITGSATWEQNTALPATTDGAWLMGVKGRARRVVMKGVAAAVDRKGALHSAEEFGSALSSGDRTGWFYWKDDLGCERQLPVGLSGPIKMNWKSNIRFEVEVECQGINFGSAGKGVFLEEPPTWVDIVQDATTRVDVHGGTPTPPLIEIAGPCEADKFYMQVGGYSLKIVDAIPAGSMLTIDCATHQITLDGKRARHAVRFSEDRWPILQTGLVDVTTSSSGQAPFVTRMMVTPLW